MVDRAAERVAAAAREQPRAALLARREAPTASIIEVRDLDGNVIKTIPPSKALDIMSGAEL